MKTRENKKISENLPEPDATTRERRFVILDPRLGIRRGNKGPLKGPELGAPEGAPSLSLFFELKNLCSAPECLKGIALAEHAGFRIKF